MEMERSDPSFRGQADYTPWFLSIYDPFVLGFMARFVWGASIQPMVDEYGSLVGPRHLDVGPGSGFFLDNAGLRPSIELTLLDPNRHVLDHVSRRLSHLRPPSSKPM